MHCKGAETDRAERRRERAFQPGPAITLAGPGSRCNGLLPCCGGTAQFLRDVSFVLEALLVLLFLELLVLLEGHREPAGPEPDDSPGDSDAGDQQRGIHVSTARSSAMRTAPAG